MHYKSTGMKYLIIALTFLTFSCAASRVAKTEFKPMQVGFKSTFLNIPEYGRKRTSDSLQYLENGSILINFNKYDVKAKQVTIEIVSKTECKITYNNKSEIFKGKLHKKGFFEIFHFKKRLEIPPVFSILYSKVHVDRIRLYLRPNNDLIIQEKYESGGNVFILAGGTSSLLKYYYKKVKT